MFHLVSVSTTPYIPKSVARARDRFKSVICQERHELVKKSSTDHFDYDSSGSDLEDILREVPKRQKLNFDSSDTCKRTGYNLKLFDRYIDVTRFGEESPLYPVCRDWVKNPPAPKKPSIGKGYGKNESVSKKESDTVEEKVITELPAPKALPNDTLGNPISSRIPGTLSILKTEDLNQLSESIWDFFDRDASDENHSLPSPAILFQAHLDRWNAVKKRWRLAAQADNQRYKKSFDIIQEAFRDIPSSD